MFSFLKNKFDIEIEGEYSDIAPKIEPINYVCLEVQPSRMTTNTKVKNIMLQLSKMYEEMYKRVAISGISLTMEQQNMAWWEVYVRKDSIKFFMIIPEQYASSTANCMRRVWSKSTVKVVNDPICELDSDNTIVTNLTLKHNPILAVSTTQDTSLLSALLDCKNFIEDKDDMMILQIGMKPLSHSWNDSAREVYEEIKQSGILPRKALFKRTRNEMVLYAAQKVLCTVGYVMEDVTNFFATMIIPSWKDDTVYSDMMKQTIKELNTEAIKTKLSEPVFDTTIRVCSVASSSKVRNLMSKSMVSSFELLRNENSFIEKIGKLEKDINNFTNRKMDYKMSDVLCSSELSNIILVPDQKLQNENSNELKIATSRSEAEIPKEVFIDDKQGIPLVTVEKEDGNIGTVFLNGKDKNKLCMTNIIIGEPGAGKTTEGANIAYEAFMRGYGVMLIDSADGDFARDVLFSIPEERKGDVIILDFNNVSMPIGIGINEAFYSGISESVIVDELVSYIECVSGNELNMMSRQWVENAIKATFTTPDATLQSVENMLSSSSFRERIIPTIQDPYLKHNWEYFHNLDIKQQSQIYDQAFRRIGSVFNKSEVKNCILQKPKKDEGGEYPIDFRKLMDEGKMVIVKCTEALGETIQTAIVSYLLSKFNLAIISREDIEDPDLRKPCFLLLDEPDHYVKGGKRWRNMLTRYRKYRCSPVFMFHGWQQLIESDKNLPKIITKSGCHYMIYKTDKENMLPIQPVIEPEFKVSELAKGMPLHHCVVKLNMANSDGNPYPCFMGKGLAPLKSRVLVNKGNIGLFKYWSDKLGRTRGEVEDYIFRNGVLMQDDIDLTDIGMDIDTDSVSEKKVIKSNNDVDEFSVQLLEMELAEKIQEQLNNGEEPDMDLILEYDSLMQEGLEEG